MCAQCGEPMSLLLQAPPMDGVLATPGAGTFLLFLCQRMRPLGICDFWDGGSGANAVLLVPPSEVGVEPTPAPAGTPVLARVWSTGWEVADDRVDPALEPQFYDERYWDLPAEVARPFDFDPRYDTKVGGVPSWTANGVVGVPPGVRMVLQVASGLSVPDSLEDVRAAIEGRPLAECSEDETGRWLTIANQCLDGTAFLFALDDGTHRMDILR